MRIIDHVLPRTAPVSGEAPASAVRAFGPDVEGETDFQAP